MVKVPQLGLDERSEPGTRGTTGSNLQAASEVGYVISRGD